MKQKPKMILFDYGGTLLCEPGWDMLRGERALFENVITNPHHYTPEELSSWERITFSLFSRSGISVRSPQKFRCSV
jgi:hypothetical protein